MKEILVGILIIVFTGKSSSQNKQSPEDFGFRYLKTVYMGDTVDILIKSRKGEELKKKPLLLFCQGSLPIPLIITDEKGPYRIFPFNTDSVCFYYHLVIIGKPGVPVVVEKKVLQNDFTFIEKATGNFSNIFQQKNFPDYYVKRNLFVINFLQKQPWISSKKLVVAGHSEGSTIAARMAAASKKITHLIFSSENPLGRMLTIIEENRQFETDSLKYGENNFSYWEKAIRYKDSISRSGKSDSYKNIYELSYPPAMKFLENLAIPVLICYGTKDVKVSPFNDYFRLEMIRRKKTNFTFKAYVGFEHNFFPIKTNGEINYEKFNWDSVINDWLNWLEKN